MRLLGALFRSLAVLLLAVVPATAERNRLIVLTDISSLTTRVREPDDGQSLIRLLLLSNEFDIEGLIASSNMGHGQVVRPELIQQAIDAYERVYPNLRLHDANYPAPTSLRQVVKAGQPVAGPKVPYSESVGEGKDTVGSRWILQALDRPDSRPVWVLIWGGSADLAQALWRAKASRTPEEHKRLVGKLRVHAVYDQDSTGAAIKQEWTDLYYMTRNHGVRGMYRGGDVALVSSEWVRTHVSEGHGELGRLYPNYDGGDIWARTLGAVRGVKEGDTPSFLFLFPNGLNRPERPELGGWGGRMVPDSSSRLRWSDAADGDASPHDPDPRMSAVYRWRSEFQNEMQSRLDWCVRLPREANHAPVVRVRGDPLREVRKGSVVKFDANRSSDPDGDRLHFFWSIYPPPPNPELRIETAGRGKAVLRVPSRGNLPASLSVLVHVRDGGSPALTRYARFEIRVSGTIRSATPDLTAGPERPNEWLPFHRSRGHYGESLQDDQIITGNALARAFAFRRIADRFVWKP